MNDLANSKQLEQQMVDWRYITTELADVLEELQWECNTNRGNIELKRYYQLCDKYSL